MIGPRVTPPKKGKLLGFGPLFFWWAFIFHFFIFFFFYFSTFYLIWEGHGHACPPFVCALVFGCCGARTVIGGRSPISNLPDTGYQIIPKIRPNIWPDRISGASLEKASFHKNKTKYKSFIQNRQGRGAHPVRPPLRYVPAPSNKTWQNTAFHKEGLIEEIQCQRPHFYQNGYVIDYKCQ